MAENFAFPAPTLTVAEWQHLIVQRIQGTTESPQLDAQVLLANFMGKSRAWILAHPEERLTDNQRDELVTALEKYLNGLPLPYILGEWEFFLLKFQVTPAVLIPRPETELLVETALKWLEEDPTRRNFADIGTGSGCIAIALAVNCTDLQGIAADISPAALEIATANARRHNVSDRLQFIPSNLLSEFPTPNSQFDLITANLPYIPSKTLRGLPVFQEEPTLALDGGPDGLDLIRALLAAVSPYLAPGGIILLEIEDAQGVAAVNLAYEYFPDSMVKCLPDLAGRDRLVKIETPL